MSAPSLSHQSSFLPISTKSRPTHLPHIPQTFPTRVFGGEATPGQSYHLQKLPQQQFSALLIVDREICFSSNSFLSDFSVNIGVLYKRVANNWCFARVPLQKCFVRYPIKSSQKQPCQVAGVEGNLVEYLKE